MVWYYGLILMMRRLLPILISAGLTVLVFWKVIFQAEFTLLTGGDMSFLFFPWFNVAAYWFKRGVFLLWDPYVYSGKANLGELQPALLYPLNWIIMLLPASGGGINLRAMEARLIFEFVIAGYSCYLLGRSFGLTRASSSLTGIAFALGGYTVQTYGWMNIFGGFVWMPLVFLFFRRALFAPSGRRRLASIVCSGFCLSLTFLAGHYGPVIHSALLLLFYVTFVLVRDWSGSPSQAKMQAVSSLAGVGLTAILLTTVQWLPSVEWGQRAYRWIGADEPIQWGQKIPYSVLQSGANASPQDVLSLLMPFMTTGANLYVGSTILFLVLVGLLFARKSEAWFFGIAAFLYLFLSWGQFSALHGWLNTFVPGAWLARAAILYLIPLQLCLSLLAGWGLDVVVEAYGSSSHPELKVFVRRAGWGMALLVLSAGIVAAWVHVHSVSIDHPYIRGAATLAVYLSILGCALFLLHSGQIRPSLFRKLVLAIVVIDLTSRFSHDLRTKTRPRGDSHPAVHELWKPPPAADFLRALRQREYFRVDDPSEVFPPNFGDAWRLDATMGHGASGLVRYLDFRGTGWGPTSNASALLNVRYFVSRIAIPGTERVFGDGDEVYRNPRAVSRAFVASRYRTFSSDDEMLRWISTPLMSPGETVLLHNRELGRIDPSFLSAVRNDHEGIEVGVLSQKTAAEKEAEKLADAEERHRLWVFHAPWGWSAGDEIVLRLRPDDPVEHCYLVLNVIPAASTVSRVQFRLTSSHSFREIPVELAGLQEGEADGPRPIAVELGPLERQEYQLSFIKTEDCSARIDSLRIARSIPEALETGTVTITSYRPNRIRLQAELKRPAFVVLSEVFYPGWQAFVDDRPTDVLAADYILRAIAVPQGAHRIEVRFRPQSFQWGLIVSLCSLTGAGIFLIRSRRKPRP